MPLLAVSEVQVEFGGIVALDNLAFTIDTGQICALIGPNGAGKTTLFNCVSRVYQPTRGSIVFDGVELLGVPAHRIARLGVARTFQNLALFPTLSVLENVMTGAYSKETVGALRDAVRWPGVARQERSVRARGRELLDRLALGHLADRQASGLPYGTLKRIEIARALASEPRLLMLDEPAAGLTHGEVDELGETVRAIRAEFGLTVLLVEHHMSMVMGISDKIVVLDLGTKIAEGSPAEVTIDPRVVEAYLGGTE